MDAKSELLEEIEPVLSSLKPLNFTFFIYVILLLMLIAIFAFPKIYIQQEIYFTSRDIAKLQSEYEALKEENRLISSSLEHLKYKNQVVDTLF